jgi:hypothetical protein
MGYEYCSCHQQASKSRGVQWGASAQMTGESIMFKEKRSNLGDRRQNNRKIGVPFKDSNGVTVRCERRLMPDRRVSNKAADIQAGKLSDTG